MFFMLSGFVMTHVYYRAFSESVGRHYRGFLLHASLGFIHCTYSFFVLFVMTTVGSQLMTGMATGSFEHLALTGPRSLGAIIVNLFMLQGLAAGKLSWNYPAWSISVEFIGYLALLLRFQGLRAPLMLSDLF